MEAALRVSGLFGMGFSGKGSGGIMPASLCSLIYQSTQRPVRRCVYRQITKASRNLTAKLVP